MIDGAPKDDVFISGLLHDVGKLVLSKFVMEFSEEIISSVQKHHMPLDKDDPVLENIVRLSNSLAIIMGYATSINGLSYRGFPDIRWMYGIEHESLENIMADVLEEIKTVESDYGFTMDA